MNARHCARRVARLLVACALWSSNAPAQQGQVALDRLLSRIPTVARDEAGIGDEEQQLAEQLQAYGAEAIPQLLPLLEHKRKGVRAFVGYVLRDAHGLTEDDLDALIKARNKGNGWIPPAIARVGTPRAIEFLVHDLERHPQTSTQVTYALKIAGEPAVIALAKRFRVKRPSDFDDCACEVFRDLGDRASAAVGPLLDAALDRSLKVDLRQRAVAALGSCRPGARRAATSLLALGAAEPDDFQGWVEIALTEMHAPECMPFLLQRLELNPDMWALRDLEPLEVDGVAAGPLVLKLLDHEDHDLRVQAAQVLGSIGYPQAVSALVPRVNDGDDWQLAAAAIGSLAKLRATTSTDELDRVAKSYWSPFVRASALRASRRLHAVAHGTVVPLGFIPEEDELRPPWEYSTEPIPVLGDGSDALTESSLGPLLYMVEIGSYGPSGSKVTREAQHPGCGLWVDGGVLLGATRGEWGGEVVFVRGGLPAEKILDANTIGLHRLGDTIVAVTGLAHMMSNHGELYRIDRRSDGSFSATWWKRLPGAPEQSGIRADGSLFVRCRGGDGVVTADGQFEFVR